MAKESTYAIVAPASGDTIRGIQDINGTPATVNFDIDTICGSLPTGSASPEGVRTGSPGWVYLQIDVALGIFALWGKKTGVGTTTGWDVIGGSF